MALGGWFRRHLRPRHVGASGAQTHAFGWGSAWGMQSPTATLSRSRAPLSVIR